MVKKKATIKRLVPHIRHFLAPYKRDILKAFLFLTLAACTVLSLGFGVRYLVDQGFSGRDPELLRSGFIFLLSASVMLSLAAYFRVRTTSWLAERVINDLRKKVFSHLITLDQSYYDTARTGDLGARLNSDTLVLLNVMTSSLATTVRSMIQLLGAGIMLIITSPKLTAVVLLVIPFVLSPIGALGRRVRELTKTVQASQGVVEASTLDYLQALQTIKIFVKEREIMGRFCHLMESKMIHVKKRVHLRALLVGMVIFLAFSAVSLVMWLGGREVLSGSLSPGDLSAFLFFALIVAGSFNSLSDLFGDLQTAAGALDRLIEVIETKPTLIDPPYPVKPRKLSQTAVTFRQVTFAYPTHSNTPILKDFSLTVGAGKTVAIVGPSGAGKTTLFNLLLRFYDPQSGDLLIGKTPVDQLSLKDLRHFFSVVPQEPVIFNATLKENILFGAPQEKKVSELTLQKVINQAALTSFIEGLPKALETRVGERGVRLSGGQKQRLAIARAFLKEAPILLLDEATNALDAESESHIQKALETLMCGKTTLVIAHRLSTVQKADHIIVLDQGRLIEEGSHEDLLQRQGLYFRYAQHQFFAA